MAGLQGRPTFLHFLRRAPAQQPMSVSQVMVLLSDLSQVMVLLSVSQMMVPLSTTECVTSDGTVE